MRNYHSHPPAKMKKGAKQQVGEPSSSGTSDPRFASFQKDPRFRLPSKKKNKTTIDKRFAHMLKDDDFTSTARVDRYGRKLKSDSKKKALERIYQEEEDDEAKSNEVETAASDDDENQDSEVEDDEIVQRELRKAHEQYDPARGGGFSSSDDDSDDDSDSSSDEEDGGTAISTSGDMQKFQDENANVQTGEVTNRIAIVNLDWDYIKSADLFVLLSSFLPSSSGKIERVSVYPSEFGKERMQQEEMDGPPRAIFQTSKEDSDSDSDSDEPSDEKIRKQLMEEGADEAFDHDILRSYQLDRLRYYYAIVVCSSPSAAKKLYDATDGSEFQSSSNVLDLRFVPDDVTFDDEPRDECDHKPKSYTPVDFVTSALQSSKVKLTWDMHPEEVSRKESIKRAFSGSRAEIDENDLRAYVASESDDDEDDGDEQDGGDGTKLSKKEAERKRLREALGLSEEPTGRKAKGEGANELVATFHPASTDSKPKEDDKEETAIEKYKRKERERKEKKRQQAKARREGLDVNVVAEQDEPEGAAQEAEDDLGFDDPFFAGADEAATKSKTAIRKEERLKKRAEREAAEAQASGEKARLAEAMAPDADEMENQADHLDHFDMNDIIRAEKHEGKKGKKGKSRKRAMATAEAMEKRGNLQEGFEMDVEDERFKAVFDDHEFAIDPSHPKFKSTKSMNKLLEEGRRRRRRGDDGDGGDEGSKSKKLKKAR